MLFVELLLTKTWSSYAIIESGLNQNAGTEFPVQKVNLFQKGNLMKQIFSEKQIFLHNVERF